MFESRTKQLCIRMATTCALLLSLCSLPLRPAISRTSPNVVQMASAQEALGGSPWSRQHKSLHQVVACFGMILGVTGIFLAYASGPLIPIVALAVAGMAMQVCGG